MIPIDNTDPEEECKFHTGQLVFHAAGGDLAGIVVGVEVTHGGATQIGVDWNDGETRWHSPCALTSQRNLNFN